MSDAARETRETPYTPPGSVHNHLSGGEQHTVVQAGSVHGGLHLHEHQYQYQYQLTDNGFTGAGSPVIATLRRIANSSHVVVDDDPPHAMPPLDQTYIVTLESGQSRATVLHAVRLEVLSRRPARRACLGLPERVALQPRHFTADLDGDPPRVRPEGVDFPFTISATDSEQFRFHPLAHSDEVRWHLELGWTCAGADGTTIIDDDGEPFETYPADLAPAHAAGPGQSWGCGFAHAPGCPAVRLAAQSTCGTVTWFTPAQRIGAVTPDNGGADLRFSDLGGRADGPSTFGAGQRVTYSVRSTPNGPEAIELRLTTEAEG